MRANRLQGTSWHAEQFHRAEDDDRRYKGRCVTVQMMTVSAAVGVANAMEVRIAWNMMQCQMNNSKQNKQNDINRRKVGEEDCF